MKRVFRAAICAVAIGVFGTFAHADVPVYYTEGKNRIFSFSLPDFWQLQSGGDRVLAAPNTQDQRRVSRVLGMEPEGNGGVWLGFVVPDGVRNLAQADAYLDEVGTSLVRNPQVTKTVQRPIAGRAAIVSSGTGTVSSQTVHFTAAVIDLPGSKVAIAIAVVEAGASAENVAQLNQIFESIRVNR